MSQFTYSFCLSLFHSIWQSAILLLLFEALHPFIKKQPPLFKRNFLFYLLLIQGFTTLFTFFIFYSGAFSLYGELISLALPGPDFIHSVSSYIFSLYSSIILIRAFLLLSHWRKFKKTSSAHLIKPSPDFRLFTLIKANELGIYRRVTLWFSSSLSTAITYGVLKPVIIIPVALLNQLSIADTESLIIHELTHIKNNDYLLNWLLLIAETIFFFNPFIILIAKKIRLEKEKACDVQVINYQYSAINYAETLVKAARLNIFKNNYLVAAVIKSNQLLRRIIFFTLDKNLSFSKRKRTAPALFTLVGALMILFHISSRLNGPGIKDNPAKVSKSSISFPVMENNSPLITQSISEIKSSDANTINTTQSARVQKMGSASINPKMKNAPSAKKTTVKYKNPNNENTVSIYAIPVVNMEAEKKELIIEEQLSVNGEVFTRFYKIHLKNGKWNRDLLYVIREGKVKQDSLAQSNNGLKNLLPLMQ